MKKIIIPVSFLFFFLFHFIIPKTINAQVSGMYGCVYEPLTNSCYSDNDCAAVGSVPIGDPCAAFTNNVTGCNNASFYCANWHGCTFNYHENRCYASNSSSQCLGDATLASPDPCLKFTTPSTCTSVGVTTSAVPCDSGLCEAGEDCCRCVFSGISCSSQLVNRCPENYVPSCNNVASWDCGVSEPKSCSCLYSPPPPSNTPTPNPGTCTCSRNPDNSCGTVNTPSGCNTGYSPSCYVYPPGGSCLCACRPDATPTPSFSSACTNLCLAQGKTAQCSFTQPSSTCSDSGTFCDAGAVGTDPTCWCCGGSEVQLQCGSHCNNPARSIANCLKSQPDLSYCERPADEDGSGLDEDGSIDCNISGSVLDCWCCDRLISNLTPKPTLDVFGTCGNNSINTAIGCLPVGDKNAFLAFILRWAIGISGGVSFILIIFSGFNIMTAAGDKRKLQSGKELLTAALSGLILIIFSVFILDLIGIRILRIPGL